MPVTVTPGNIQAERINTSEIVHSPLDLLKGACKQDYENCSQLLHFSFDSSPSSIIPSPNGFIHGAIEAYNNHHHLRLRPDDIWFAILSQLRLYITRHPEEGHEMFNFSREQKKLTIRSDCGFFDFEQLMRSMSNEIDKNVRDPAVKEWMMPTFSTTTCRDKAVASVLVMGSLGEKSRYTYFSRCSLPSVTLLGEKDDWEKILGRLDRLKELGDEPTQFCALLTPVISRFILSFEAPDSEEVKTFWNCIAYKPDLECGTMFYSGWIGAFCFWNLDGKTTHQNSPEPFRLDGTDYHAISLADFPPGYASVPVLIEHKGELLDAVLVAGSVGLGGYTTEDTVYENTISPETGWWLFTEKSGDAAR